MGSLDMFPQGAIDYIVERSEEDKLREHKRSIGQCMCLKCTEKAAYEGYCLKCYANIDGKCS